MFEERLEIFLMKFWTIAGGFAAQQTRGFSTKSRRLAAALQDALFQAGREVRCRAGKSSPTQLSMLQSCCM
jgi:hypothetical protein